MPDDQTPAVPTSPEKALDDALLADAAAPADATLQHVEFGLYDAAAPGPFPGSAWWQLIYRTEARNAGPTTGRTAILFADPPPHGSRLQIIHTWRKAYFTDKRDVPTPARLAAGRPAASRVDGA